VNCDSSSKPCVQNVAQEEQFLLIYGKSKGKAVPLQAWSGPEGSRKFPDLMTTAQDCGKVVSLTYRPPLPPGNTAGTHFCWSLLIYGLV